MYNYEHFKNLNELNKKYPDVTKRLLKYSVIPNGEWTEDEIYVYNSPEDFAHYQIEAGWLSTSITEHVHPHLPDLREHINFTTLAADFMCTWDDSEHYYDEETGYILTTNNEW